MIDTVVETQLELQLLPGLDKTDVALDASGHLVIKPDSTSWWNITPEILHELYIPALSLWSAEDLRNCDRANLNIFLKLLSMKRSPTFFDQDWHRKTTLSPNSNSLQSLGMTDFQEFTSSLEDKLVSRTVIATRNYLTIAPDITQPGDVICLLSGCDAPVILRPRTTGTFTFIGDAFIGSDQSGQDQMFERLNGELLSKFGYIVLI